ncbi:MAG: ABC transporter ATP-binding protein/permease [Treponema sp.]|nr:ABC transporter ATP-binding protein/permease [Treponema sp.]
MKIVQRIGFGYKMLWSSSKWTACCCALAVVAQVAWHFMGIYTPRVVIDQITSGADPLRFVMTVGAAAVALALAGFLRAYTDRMSNNATGTMGIFRAMMLKTNRETSIDYAMIDDPRVKKIREKAGKAIDSNHAPALNIPRTTVGLSVNVINFFLYGGIILAVNPIIILLLGVSVAISALFMSLSRKYERKTREERARLRNGVRVAQRYMGEEARAKDIRLYGIDGFLRSFARGSMRSLLKAEGSVAARDMRTELVSALLILARDGAAYVFLTYLLINGRMDLGEFVFIFAAIGMFSTWITGINQRVSELLRATSEMADIMAYLNLENESNSGPGAPLPPRGEAPALALRGASFTYPEAEKPTLKNINLEIKAGERVAIVGNNGAGKTTLIKLICGLLRPTEGEALLNGINSGAYNYEQYLTMFSAVFQDIHLLAESIETNVSQSSEAATDPRRARECLERAGLWEKTQTLPLKEKTPLVRRVNADATELSGGEKQKLAIARALYRDAPAIILDEPTAALDPIAESQVYEQYAELMRGKTAIFISHRLASTRFCDRIILVDEGEIAETGSHDELMAAGGKYARMFALQAQYYN